MKRRLQNFRYLFAQEIRRKFMMGGNIHSLQKSFPSSFGLLNSPKIHVQINAGLAFKVKTNFTEY